MKDALPITPSKKISAYLRTTKSPTAHYLPRRGVIPSPEERKENKISASVVEDSKHYYIDSEKFERSDRARTSVTACVWPIH